MRISDWSSDVCSSDLPRKVEQQPLEIAADLNVHARRCGRRHRARAIVAAGQRAVENVVDVRRDDEPSDRQPHLRRDIAREHIAEIARRSEEHTSELQSLMRNSYAVVCLKKKNTQQ